MLPLLALCNTAIVLSADVLPQFTSWLALGVGLLRGIIGVTVLPVRLKLGFTAGIGFFLATLSFQDPATVDLAKLLGSAASALLGALILAPGRLTEEGRNSAKLRATPLAAASAGL